MRNRRNDRNEDFNDRRERFSNDDHSRYAGPDYRGPEENFELGYPGVSGKTLHGRTWFNRDQYDEQRRFMGKGPKGYRRSDDRIYEEVCERLMRSPDVDATNIGVKVDEGHVTLEGTVDSRQQKRMAEYLIEDLPGVYDVRNALTLREAKSENAHPDKAVKKDLGINDERSEYR